MRVARQLVAKIAAPKSITNTTGHQTNRSIRDPRPRNCSNWFIVDTSCQKCSLLILADRLPSHSQFQKYNNLLLHSLLNNLNSYSLNNPVDTEAKESSKSWDNPLNPQHNSRRPPNRLFSIAGGIISFSSWPSKSYNRRFLKKVNLLLNRSPGFGTGNDTRHRRTCFAERNLV